MKVEGFITTCARCQGEGKIALGHGKVAAEVIIAIRCDNCGYMIVSFGDGIWKEVVEPKDVQ